MRLAFDIETDGLLEQLTVIHSLCIADVDTGEAWSCSDHPEYVSPLGHKALTIDEGLKMLTAADKIIGHNIIKFDIPAIQKVKPLFNVRREQAIDTLILSRLIWPELRNLDFEQRKKNEKKVRRNLKYMEEDHHVQQAAAIAEYKAAHMETVQTRLEAGWGDSTGDDREVLDWAYRDFPDYKAPEHSDFDPDLAVKEALTALFPGQLIGSHGLEAWGYRLGEWKGDYSKDMKAKGLDPWAEWNTAMQEYCEQDVIVTVALLYLQESKEYAPRAIEIERDFAWIIAEMERNGFPFHMEKALKLQARLMRRQAELMVELQEAFPPIEETWDFTPKVNNSKLGYVKGETITKSKTIIFNPGSRDHIAKWLKKKYGWKPKGHTTQGKPIVDEKVLKALKYPEAALLAEYFLLDKRLGMLEGKGGKGLIPAGRSGRIHGSVNTNGAVTRRCTHSHPNMAQLPAVNVPFGKDFRELMYAPPGYSLLGWDASGLELRCFAHYMALYDNGQYTGIVLDGDIHWKHVIALGLYPEGTEYDEHDAGHSNARNKIAKRFIYAYLYGAGPELIGEIMNPLGSSASKRRAGNKLIKEFLSRTPALKKLKKRLGRTIEDRGMQVMGIDGGMISVRSKHSDLNTLLQSSGAIAVKLATIMFYDKLIAAGLVSGVDFMLVAHVHDEVQTLVKKGLEDFVGKIAIEAMQEAGEALGFKCPLTGEYKYGSNWKETH